MKINATDRIAAQTLVDNMNGQYGPAIMECAKEVLAKSFAATLGGENASTGINGPAMECVEEMKAALNRSNSGPAILTCLLLEDSHCPSCEAALTDIPTFKGPLTREDAVKAQQDNGCIRGYVLLTLRQAQYYAARNGLMAFFSNAIVEHGEECVTSLKYTPLEENEGVIKVLVSAVVDAQEAAVKGSRVRLKELLDALINQKIEESGMDVREVIENLLDAGFTADELIENFAFAPDDVDDITGDSDEDEADEDETDEDEADEDEE